MATIYGTNNDFKVPSLDLRFADRKNLVDTISGRNLITFSRDSIGTYVDENGVIQSAASGAARFDHDPVTGESLGLLVEEARTNLFLNSDSPVSQRITLSDSTTYTSSFYGTGTATITTASTTVTSGELLVNGEFNTNFDNWSEGGLATASVSNGVLNVVTTTTYRGVTQQLPTTPGKFYKATFRGRILSGGGYIDIVCGDVIPAVINTGSFVERTGYFLATSTTTSITLRQRNAGEFEIDYARIKEVSPSTVATLTGSGAYPTRSNETFTTGTSIVVSNRYWIEVSGSVDKVQLEAGSFPTSYIPTEGSQVTRAADVVSITGTNFSSWYNQSEGTVLFSSRPISLTSNNGQNGSSVFINSDNNNFLALSNDPRSGGGGSAAVFSGGTTQYNSNLMGSGISNKSIALAYKTNDFSASTQGLATVTDNFGTLPVPNKVNIGVYPPTTPDFFANGTISRLTYYPTRLSNSLLQKLTK